MWVVGEGADESATCLLRVIRETDNTFLIRTTPKPFRTTLRETPARHAGVMTIEGLQWRVAALNAEWGRLSSQKAPDAWRVGGACPARAQTLSEVLDAVRSHPDEVLRALVTASLGGDSSAGRVVIQAMLPKMILMAKRDAEHDLGAYLAALWERVQTYPLGRRPNRIAANLALDTLKMVKRQSTGQRTAVQQPVVLTDWAMPAGLASATEAEQTTRGGAARVLNRARFLGVIDDQTKEVLSVVYLDGRSAAQAGQELGLSPDAVRARCSRAVRQMRRHAAELACVAG